MSLSKKYYVWIKQKSKLDVTLWLERNYNEVGHICSSLHGTKQGQRACKKIKKDVKPQKR